MEALAEGPTACSLVNLLEICVLEDILGWIEGKFPEGNSGNSGCRMSKIPLLGSRIKGSGSKSQGLTHMRPSGLNP